VTRNKVDKDQSEAVAKALAFLNRGTGRMATLYEAREAIGNIVGFFQILSEWNCKIHNEDTQADTPTSFHADRRMHGEERTR
jgi:hypothetical protein